MLSIYQIRRIVSLVDHLDIVLHQSLPCRLFVLSISRCRRTSSNVTCSGSFETFVVNGSLLPNVEEALLYVLLKRFVYNTQYLLLKYA
jgi:hypothetical protein